jgi:A/G-specific adenine glycosylase
MHLFGETSEEMIDPAKFSTALEEWYCLSGRKLPWRETTDPYKIWVSEVMLQQTQVPRVKKDFYPNFLEKFPTVESLAQAKWHDVFPVWRGLGFYSRGKNMLRAAQKVVQDFNGEFPKEQKSLESLPGIGTYTARAIRAFSWDEKVAAVDTNIQKIIEIVYPQETVEIMAQKLVMAAKSGCVWNNAMMDLASAIRAGEKIEGTLGLFFTDEMLQAFKPEKKESALKQKKSGKFRIEVGAACILRDGKYLIQTRPTGKSFVGQWEFPGGKREKGESFRDCVKREIQEELGIDISVRPHFCEITQEFEKTILILRFHRCQIQSGDPIAKEGQELRWVDPSKFDGLNFLETNGPCLEKLKKMRA